MILVVGATSRLGSVVAAELARGGHGVRAACRTPARAGALAAAGVEVVPIDVADPASFGAALAGVTRVFTAVHGLTARAPGSVGRIDRDGHVALIAAARERGVERFVYTSAMGAAADHPSGFWRAKAQVERALAASGLAFTILRPSAFMDFHAHALIGAPVLAGKPANVLGTGQARRNLVAVSDVAAVAVAALTTDRFIGRTLEIGGPDNLSDLEVAEVYAALAGRGPPKVRRLGPRALRVLSAVLGPFHAGVANILRTPLETDGLDLTFDAAAMEGLLGRPPLSLAEYARAHR